MSVAPLNAFIKAVSLLCGEIFNEAPIEDLSTVEIQARQEYNSFAIGRSTNLAELHRANPRSTYIHGLYSLYSATNRRQTASKAELKQLLLEASDSFDLAAKERRNNRFSNRIDAMLRSDDRDAS